MENIAQYGYTQAWLDLGLVKEAGTMTNVFNAIKKFTTNPTGGKGLLAGRAGAGAGATPSAAQFERARRAFGAPYMTPPASRVSGQGWQNPNLARQSFDLPTNIPGIQTGDVPGVLAARRWMGPTISPTAPTVAPI